MRQVNPTNAMETWQTILIALGGNAAMLAVLAYLAKLFIGHRLSRDISSFQSELKATSDAAIERLKSDLQLHAIEHQVRFSRLHEKRATVIAELNSLIAEAMWEAENFLSILEFPGEPSKREKYHTTMTKLVELSRYFDKHRIYLSSEVIIPLEALVQKVRTLVTRFGVYLHWEDRQLQDHTRADKNKAWNEGWEAIRNDIPAARRTLENEFRAILNGTSSLAG